MPTTLKSQAHKSKICTQQNHLIIIFIIIGTRFISIFPTFQIRFLFRKQLVNGNSRTFKFESGNFFINFIRNPIYIFVQILMMKCHIFSGQSLQSKTGIHDFRRMTVRVSCISGSKSPQPVLRNRGISTSISQHNFRLNPILFPN